MALGIKNSWKYEKDLIIIFNPNDNKKTISYVGNILLTFINKMVVNKT